jgi:hypothetical protein
MDKRYIFLTEGVKWDCTKTINSIMNHVEDSAPEWFHIAWNPSGSHFALACLHGEVKVFNKSYKEVFQLSHFEDVAQCQFSPNGIFLLCVGFKKNLTLWCLEECRTKPIYSTSHSERITFANWSSKDNAVYLADESGSVIYWKSFINESKYPHPVTGKPKLLLDKEDTEALFGIEDSEDEFDKMDDDIDFSKLNEIADTGLMESQRSSHEKKDLKLKAKQSKLLDLEAVNEDNDDIEDLGEDLDDFVVDDDGAGCIFNIILDKQDMQTEEGYAGYFAAGDQDVFRDVEKSSTQILTF